MAPFHGNLHRWSKKSGLFQIRAQVEYEGVKSLTKIPSEPQVDRMEPRSLKLLPLRISNRRCETLRRLCLDNPDCHGRLWPNRLWPNRLWQIFRPILANRGLDRLWPNRLWPILVFQSFDRLWPNRLWPILVLVFWRNFQVLLLLCCCVVLLLCCCCCVVVLCVVVCCCAQPLKTLNLAS